jgi:hypothetical protein
VRESQDHCQSCGSTNYEDLHGGDQGYTACCNERVVSECDLVDCGHGEAANYYGEYVAGRGFVAVRAEG